MQKLRLIFFGTPDFSVPFLKELLDAEDIEVVAVVTQPDKPVGRAQQVEAPPVKILAEERGVTVLQFPTLKKLEVNETLKALNADVFVVVAYGKLIPPSLLTVPRLGCVNVHPSFLPKYRGPSPIQAAIENGDDVTAVSIMLLDEGMDTGPLIAQKTVEVKNDDTYTSLSERLASVSAPFLVEALRLYISGAVSPTPQDDTNASVTKLLDRESGRIDWKESAETIERKIRAYTPWPGCFSVVKHHGKELRVKILKARLGTNGLEILDVQPEGKKPMSYVEYSRGYPKLNSTA